MTGPDALWCSGLTKAFGRTEVLRGVDLRVPEGSVTAVLGPSGSGKTTLLRVVAGFERADAGTVTLRGELVSGPGTHRPPERRHVGVVPQEGALFPHLSVAGNIGFGIPRRARAERVAEMLALVDLEGYEDQPPHQLSGGQQQRVALARALAPRPSLVLLDEPFSSLDAGLRAEVRAEVCDLLRRAAATAVLVTHDNDEALSIADQVVVLLDGTVAQAGDPMDVYRSPQSIGVATFVGESVVVPIRRHGAVAESPLGRLELAGVGPDTGDLVAVVRPEQIRIGPTVDHVCARVVATRFHGHSAVVELAVPGAVSSVVARVSPDLLPCIGTDVPIHVVGPVNAFLAPPADASRC